MTFYDRIINLRSICPDPADNILIYLPKLLKINLSLFFRR